MTGTGFMWSYSRPLNVEACALTPVFGFESEMEEFLLNAVKETIAAEKS